MPAPSDGAKRDGEQKEGPEHMSVKLRPKASHGDGSDADTKDRESGVMKSKDQTGRRDRCACRDSDPERWERLRRSTLVLGPIRKSKE